MKITSIIILPFLFSQVFLEKNNKILQDHSHTHIQLVATTAPYLHICYNGNYRVDKLDPQLIYDLYKEKDVVEFTDSYNLCAIKITKIQDPKFKYSIELLDMPKDDCEKTSGFNTICNEDSNCTQAIFCGELSANKSINTFDLIELRLNSKNSIYDNHIKKWIYNYNGKQKCTYSQATKCIQIKSESGAIKHLPSVNDASVILMLFLFYYSLLTS